MAGDPLGDQDALGRRDVRQLRVARALAEGHDVAQRGDALDVGAIVRVHLHVPALQLEPDRLDAEPVGDRASTRGDQQVVGGDRLRLAVGALRLERHALALHLRPGDLRADQRGDALLLERAREFRRHRLVFDRHQPREQLDDGDLAAEAVEDRRELDADGAAAHDDDRPGTSLRWIASSLVMMRVWSMVMPGTLRGDEPVATMMCRAVNSWSSPPVTTTLPWPARRAVPLIHAMPFFLNRLSMPLVRPETILSLRAWTAVTSSVGVAPPSADAPVGGVLDDLERVRVLEQRLGRDAAPQQAGAAQRFLPLDDRRLQAQLRRADGRDVAAGPGANHDEVESLGHGGSQLLKDGMPQRFSEDSGMNVVAGSGAGGSGAASLFRGPAPSPGPAGAHARSAGPSRTAAADRDGERPAGLGKRPEGDEQGKACQKTGPDHQRGSAQRATPPYSIGRVQRCQELRIVPRSRMVSTRAGTDAQSRRIRRDVHPHSHGAAGRSGRCLARGTGRCVARGMPDPARRQRRDGARDADARGSGRAARGPGAAGHLGVRDAAHRARELRPHGSDRHRRRARCRRRRRIGEAGRVPLRAQVGRRRHGARAGGARAGAAVADAAGAGAVGRGLGHHRPRVHRRPQPRVAGRGGPGAPRGAADGDRAGARGKRHGQGVAGAAAASRRAHRPKARLSP